MWKKHTASLVILALVTIFISKICFGGEESPSPLTYQEKQKLLRNEHPKKCSSVNKNTLPALKFSSRQSLISAGANLLYTDSVPSAAVNIPDGTHISTATHWNQTNYYIHGMVYVDPNVLFAISGNIYFDSSVSNAGIVLSSGVKFIAEGKPENSIKIQSDTGAGSQDYNFFIKTDPLTTSVRVRYCEIYNAYAGFWLVGGSTIKNITIQDCMFWGNYLGMHAEGPMELTVANNHFIDCTVDGVDISMADVNGLVSGDSEYTIKGNLINGNQQYGVWVDGSQDYYNTGLVNISDNLIVGSQQYAVVFANGYIASLGRICQGYYDNAAIVPSGDPFAETNPVYLTQDPFQNGRYQYPFFLKHDCGLIDKGSEPISQTDQLGKFTCSDAPDSNMIDIGVHYFISEYANAGSLSADFTNDGIVDYNDLGLFASYWLYNYNDNYNCWAWDFDDSGLIDLADFEVIANNWLTSFDFVDFADFANYWRRTVDYKFQDRRFDLNGDGFVNFEDFAMFADQWRQTTDNPNPTIFASVSGDPGNQNGTISITANNARSTEFVRVYMDGQPVGTIDYRIDADQISDTTTFDSAQYPNGQHYIKLAAVDSNDAVILSDNLAINVNNDWYYFTKDDGFDDTGFNIAAINASPKEIRAKLTDWYGVLQWTSDTMTGNLDCHIPGSILTGAIYDIAVETRPSSLMMQQNPVRLYADSGDWVQTWKDAIAKKYDENGYYRVQIFLPNGKNSVADCRKQAVAELVHWSGGNCAVWYRGAANWKTFSKQVTRPNTEVVYIVSHGFATYNNSVNRLNFLISSSGLKGWFGGTDYVFSHKDGIPGADTDSSIHSLHELNLTSIGRNRFIVYHAACVQGKSSEMANEWLSSGYQQIYFSFPAQMPLFSTGWQTWDYQMWNQWCNSRTTFYDALDYCSKSAHNPSGPSIYTQLMELGGIYGDMGTMFN